MLTKEVAVDSIENTIVPAVSYGSDEGLIGGILYDRKNYKGQINPYKNRLRGKALVSTQGFIEVEAQYEQTQTWNGSIRSIIDLYFHRFTADNYFGIGNATPFSDEGWKNGYYDFQSLGWELSYDGYYPIYQRGNRQLDLQFGAGIEFENPQAKNDSTSFVIYPPNGQKGGWTNYLSAGLIFENRDRPFDSRHGNRTEIRFSYAPSLISDYGLVTAQGQFRQYFQPFSFLTIANMLNIRYVGGDVPYWKMSTLGDDNTLRGYPLNRFQGNASVAYTLELRSWLLTFPQFYNLRLGGHLFTDMGRVFTDEDNFSDTFRNYHQTFGIGGTLSVLQSDFILRGELGFSEDTSRIYIGLGYLF
ncbi:hypothetical protein [Fodinibius salsisoli]|uniref:BamA/TamA family outer membrane protein n=1 Tax=Fodinibius salsisoli TaxID=2820877 RepID=A0ABT3PME7_9BACT|nr:hypothetical protein [Fodinibius salsisoli]MCW9707082.1 BamA/TamA family outer membrane protein [Fodinibius salsisoli]